MIASELINPLTLPSVSLADRRQLPSVSGIYLALSTNDEVLYIGRSVNIARRWLQGRTLGTKKIVIRRGEQTIVQ